ncbi:hypothetical protein [Acetobacter orleanensis]|nr:hypothetical protein [Acetobacter orleanensis]
MRWFRSRLICHLLGHRWSDWTLQRSWDGKHDFHHRHCTRPGCLATEKES